VLLDGIAATPTPHDGHQSYELAVRATVKLREPDEARPSRARLLALPVLVAQRRSVAATHAAASWNQIFDPVA
jgi:hypothetical protein